MEFNKLFFEFEFCTKLYKYSLIRYSLTIKYSQCQSTFYLAYLINFEVKIPNLKNDFSQFLK